MSVIDTIKAFAATAPVNVEALIESFGIDLQRKASLHPDIIGEIQRLDNGRYRIAVNETDNYYRRRFTMAHELGHYLLHRDLIGNGVDDNRAYRSVNIGNFYNRDITPEHETEANQFAANLLLPSNLIRQHYAELKGDVAALAKMFQISQEAMGYRLEGLDLGE